MPSFLPFDLTQKPEIPLAWEEGCQRGSQDKVIESKALETFGLNASPTTY